ncbi:DUF5916 domain-containing protein [Gammaproteobacteria bacterium]|nr:DUF5916 domain-containing protein [Gammaproteobacteria bacterium]MDB2444150.1 DUF5916 domain-containing protein [Gammaproteobacteria bacterium]
MRKLLFQLRHLLLLAMLWLGIGIAFAQTPQITRVTESTANIKLDGYIDEAVWNDLPIIDGMRVINPDTLAETPYETHIRFFYTEKGIYVGVINFQPSDTLIARMTTRDTQLDRDGFVVGIDASGEGLYGYFLRINLGDSMTDASLLPERTMNMQWDGAWNGRTQALDNGWSVEYFIPWSMMPLPQVESVRQMGLYFERQVGHLNGEAWSNPPLPRTVNQYLSAFEKYELRDIEPRRQLTYYPFVSSVYEGVGNRLESKIGSELFWRPTTNTLLSATLNPDFGNVESDDVVVNLTAYEVFFPERRSFFLEGQDIFNNSPRTVSRPGPGWGPISLLNTRRIGGSAIYDVPENVEIVPTDLSRPSDLLGAAKLTGQNGNWRYGALFAIEDDSQLSGNLDDGTPISILAAGRDFSVGRLLYQDTSRGGRRSIGWMGTNYSHPTKQASVNALDMHFFSADSRWVVDTQVMKSEVNNVSGNGYFADFNFRPERGVNHSLRMTYMDDTLDINELGFLSRNDAVYLDYSWSKTESDIKGLRQRTTSFSTVNRANTDGDPIALGFILGQNYNFLNNSSVNYRVKYFPKRVDDRLGRGTGNFRIVQREGLDLSFSTNPAEEIAYKFSLNLDQDELGPEKNTVSAGVSWRPDDRFSFDLNLRYTDQEALLIHKGSGRYTSFEAHQWAPRAEVNYFITAQQQLRFTMQWTALKAFEDRFWQVNVGDLDFLQNTLKPSDQSDNFVISRLTFQARYRWQIAPLSDLFLVYTRGSNLPRDEFMPFQNLFEQSWNDRIVDTIAFKLRYRLGS